MSDPIQNDVNRICQMAASAAEAATTARTYGYNVGDQMFIINQGSIRLATVIYVAQKRVTVSWSNSVRTMTRPVTPTTSIFQWSTSQKNDKGLVVTALTDKQKILINNARYSKVRIQIKEMANQQDGLKPAGPLTPDYDLVGAIIDFETGELDKAGVLNLFSHLIKTGMAWTLQGSYGRMAASLIESGHISRTGDILEPA